MNLVDFPAELIVLIGDALRIDKYFGYNEFYLDVARFCLTAKAIDRAIVNETNKRHEKILAGLSADELAFEKQRQPRRRYRFLLPNSQTREQLVIYAQMRWGDEQDRKHYNKMRHRGKTHNTIFNLGNTLSLPLEFFGDGWPKKSTAFPILVIRVHPKEQRFVNDRTWRIGTFVTGMRVSSDTDQPYLAMPGNYELTDKQKKWIRSLYGRYFITTIGELKEALDRDDATEGVKAAKEYDEAPTEVDNV